MERPKIPKAQTPRHLFVDGGGRATHDCLDAVSNEDVYEFGERLGGEPPAMQIRMDAEVKLCELGGHQVEPKDCPDLPGLIGPHKDQTGFEEVISPLGLERV